MKQVMSFQLHGGMLWGVMAINATLVGVEHVWKGHVCITTSPRMGLELMSILRS
jgi:hypothetical protein